MLLDNLKVMSRPVSYIEYDIETLDNAEHDVSFILIYLPNVV